MLGLADKRGLRRRSAVARRAARARSRHGAGEPAAAGAARRADGRHGPGRIGAHGAAHRRACAQRSTVVLIEHDVDAVFRLADRVSVLVGGRIIASGEPDEVRRHPEVDGRLSGRRRRDTSLACRAATSRPAHDTVQERRRRASLRQLSGADAAQVAGPARADLQDGRVDAGRR